MGSEPNKTESRTFTQWLKDLPRWKLGMLSGSAVLALTGGILMLVQGSEAPVAGGPEAGLGGPESGGATFLPGGTTNPGNPEASVPPEGEPAAKGVFRLGSSFLIGFCVGAFLRTAVKIAAIVVGFFLVGLFLLDQAGFVIVDWNAIDQAWNGFWANVGDEWGNFQSFMTGRLPAAGLASLGLYAGFRRN